MTVVFDIVGLMDELSIDKIYLYNLYIRYYH